MINILWNWPLEGQESKILQNPEHHQIPSSSPTRVHLSIKLISDTRNSIFSSKHQCFFKIQCFLPLICLNRTSLSWLGPSFLMGQAPTFFHALFMCTYLVSLDSISSPPWADRDPALRRHGLAFSFVVAASGLWDLHRSSPPTAFTVYLLQLASYLK